MRAAEVIVSIKQAQNDFLKAEDVICFYHKEAEMYLDFEPSRAADRPQLKYSHRVSTKDRKKSSWFWKIENATVNSSADQVHCTLFAYPSSTPKP